MALTVVDPTGQLPWWMSPADAGNAPGPASDWLSYLSRMYGAGMPTAGRMGLPALQGGQPSPAQNLLAALNANRFPPAPPQPPTTPTGTYDFFTSNPARPAGVSATGLPLAPGSLSPASLAQFGPGAGMPTPGAAPAYTGSTGAAVAPINPSAPARPNPLQAGGQSTQGVTANPGAPPFAIPINFGAAGGRGGRNDPIYTALNLGRQTMPQAIAGLTGAASPLAAAAPTPGPLAARPVTTNAPWGMGPLQRGLDWAGLPFGAHSGFQ